MKISIQNCMFSEHKAYSRMLFMLLFIFLCSLVPNFSVLAQNDTQPMLNQGKRSSGLSGSKLGSNSGNTTITETSRAELLKMSTIEFKAKLSTINFVVKDLINATPEQLSSRNQNIAYFTVAEFYDFPLELKMEAIQNPDRYVFTNHKSEIPKIVMSLADYELLDSKSKELVKNSGEYIIK